MKQVEVSDETYERLAFAAKVFGVAVGDVVARLVEAPTEPAQEPASPPRATPASADDEPDQVAVHVVYQGKRISGRFDRTTHQLRITSGPLTGKTYPSASAAAIAVVQSVNPARAFPQTNGRTFWIVDSTGKTLRALIGPRSAKS
ncbi:hypothetical protein [Planosporangium mesophilum]|uniref:Uncharacterized protein n=1 Tax=Planosporangium mesophilum TaxID=689768 RepID=A0A8J3TAL4_9ACTN|nr:hypothetical protein [Planosporangium mesophilum]NJC84885.1 hypothetical protein [Planosporangium mesophilum]GII23650.1 hypothetical protein Pme01_32470 [Planosporangium mesophilum]